MYVYLYIYIYINNPSTTDTQSAQISQKQDKQCPLPVITTMALWQLMHLPQSHCGDIREGTLFS